MSDIAFDAFLAMHAEAVGRTALQLADGDEDLCDDLVQEGLILLWYFYENGWVEESPAYVGISLRRHMRAFVQDQHEGCGLVGLSRERLHLIDTLRTDDAAA